MQSPQFQLHAKIEQSHWWFVARRRIMRRIVRDALPPNRSTTIVDVGCGTGANIATLADDYDCIGIDTSGEAIELAKPRFPRVRYLQGYAPGDLGEIASQSRLFLLMDVLEHVSDDFALLSELLAAARPGAQFLLTVPADMELWSKHDESFGHFRRYTLDRFARVWDGLPVKVRLLSYYNARLYPLVKAIRTANRRKQRTRGAADTDFTLPSKPVNWLLQNIFAGERHRLAEVLSGHRPRGYRRGVSLIAVLERQSGEIHPRRKPQDVEADVHAPTELPAPVVGGSIANSDDGQGTAA